MPVLLLAGFCVILFANVPILTSFFFIQDFLNVASQ